MNSSKMTATEQFLTGLQSLLDSRNITRSQLADMLGITRAMVSQYFHRGGVAGKELSLGTVERICKTLNCSPVLVFQMGAEESSQPYQGNTDIRTLRKATRLKELAEPPKRATAKKSTKMKRAVDTK